MLYINIYEVYLSDFYIFSVSLTVRLSPVVNRHRKLDNRSLYDLCEKRRWLLSKTLQAFL